jgi:hypothetical protein
MENKCCCGCNITIGPNRLGFSINVQNLNDSTTSLEFDENRRTEGRWFKSGSNTFPLINGTLRDLYGFIVSNAFDESAEYHLIKKLSKVTTDYQLKYSNDFALLDSRISWQFGC